MPDTKLNWANLREHLRKNLLIYIVVVAVALVLTNLLWMTTAPRVPEEAQVLIYLAGPYSNPTALDAVAADMLTRGQEYDGTLQAVEFQSLLYADPEQDYTGVMLLMTRLATGEGDAFLADINAMQALENSGALLGLDDYYAAGWMADSGLEPYYSTWEDEETGQSVTQLTGFRIDSLDFLRDSEAFENRGAFLTVAANSTNVETTMRALSIMVEDLKKAVPTTNSDLQK